MTALLNEFRVNGLYGFKNFHLNLEDNVLVIVGENGSGKTTLLRMLFYFLSGRWQSLIQFRFVSVEAKIDGQIFKVEHKDIMGAFKNHSSLLFRTFPPRIRSHMQEMIASGQF